jgi:hypothetical protein
MRRWPFSTITMPTSTRTNRPIRGMSSAHPFSARIWANWPGMLDTTLAKISSDMPLPMPRWVMSSPIHMSSAVPAVRVSTTSRMRPALALPAKRSVLVGLPPLKPPPPFWNRKVRPVDCMIAMAIVR